MSSIDALPEKPIQPELLDAISEGSDRLESADPLVGMDQNDSRRVIGLAFVVDGETIYLKYNERAEGWQEEYRIGADSPVEFLRSERNLYEWAETEYGEDSVFCFPGNSAPLVAEKFVEHLPSEQIREGVEMKIPSEYDEFVTRFGPLGFVDESKMVGAVLMVSPHSDHEVPFWVGFDPEIERWEVVCGIKYCYHTDENISEMVELTHSWLDERYDDWEPAARENGDRFGKITKIQ